MENRVYKGFTWTIASLIFNKGFIFNCETLISEMSKEIIRISELSSLELLAGRMSIQ